MSSKGKPGQACNLIIKWKDQDDTEVFCLNQAEVDAQVRIHKSFSNFKKAVPKWYTPK